MSPYHNSIKKRVLDLCFSLLILPIAIPIFFLSILLVWIFSGSPVLFKQTRIGKSGKEFQLIKIRSLRKSFNSNPGAWHNPSDITLEGRFLRSMRIDEIPQIWNILKGEMSWVGPRPEVPFYYEHFRDIDADYTRRQLVRPGITGLAQLKNPNASPSENLEKLKFDLEYVEYGNLRMDVRILIQSFLFIWK